MVKARRARERERRKGEKGRKRGIRGKEEERDVEEGGRAQQESVFLESTTPTTTTLTDSALCYRAHFASRKAARKTAFLPSFHGEVSEAAAAAVLIVVPMEERK